MTLFVKHSGNFKTVQKLWVKSAGVWKEVVKLFRKELGQWRLPYDSGVPGGGGGGAILPVEIIGWTPGSDGTSVATSSRAQSKSVAPIVGNGSGQFTYSWAVLSDTSGGSIVAGANAMQCTFNTGVHAPAAVHFTTLRLTITDTGDGNRLAVSDWTRTWEWGAI
jgi:hypothetical protein